MKICKKYVWKKFRYNLENLLFLREKCFYCWILYFKLYESRAMTRIANGISFSYQIPSNSASQAEDKSPNIIYDYIKNSKNLFTDNWIAVTAWKIPAYIRQNISGACEESWWTERWRWSRYRLDWLRRKDNNSRRELQWFPGPRNKQQRGRAV